MTEPVIYDISPPIDDSLRVFPGDTPPTREVLLDMKDDAPITLSTWRSTVHVGAHVDAPSHYGVDGRTIDAQSIELYMGPAHVVHVAVARGALITPDMIDVEIEHPRVLFRTVSYPDPSEWNEDFAAFDPSTIEWLADRGVKLVGIDTPSVDPSTSKELPAHRTVLARDLAILEGIVLSDVPAGDYELIALPLRLVGFDASPVRAILRSLRS